MLVPKTRPRLLAEISIPGDLRLEHDPVPNAAVTGGPRLVFRDRDEITVHLLNDLLNGDAAPVAVFPDPESSWTRGGACVAADNSFTAFSGRSAVTAVASDGDVLWEYQHGCWDCGDIESGSTAITTDSSQVWATVPADHSRDPAADYAGDLWLVLDSDDGSLLSQAQLDCVAAGSHHLVQPSGDGMALSVGEGQDGVPAYWGRYNGADVLSLRGLGQRSLVALSPSGSALLSTSHYGEDLQLHHLPHAEAAWAIRAEDFPWGQDSVTTWAYQSSFVDDDLLIVSSSPARGPALHALVRAMGGSLVGRLAYPEPVSRPALGLGDGTWLTYEPGGCLRRWTA
jgi:hypothetical protein